MRLLEAKWFKAWCVAAFLVFAASAAYAQGVAASGGLQGTITDATGSIIPNVSVSAVDTERGTKYTAASDSLGQYHLSGLAPGTYDVTAEFSGFATKVQKKVTVSVGAVTTVDFGLTVAQTGTVVEVNAAPPGG